MGNAAKRREIAKLLKERGCGKLYRGRKFKAFRQLDAVYYRSLLHKLQFKVGDIVNDCDGYNHKIKAFIDAFYYYDIKCIDQFEFEDGRWSCGCGFSPDPPKSRDDIEKYILQAFKDHHDMYERNDRYQALLRGEHICDENGILLPEFK